MKQTDGVRGAPFSRASGGGGKDGLSPEQLDCLGRAFQRRIEEARHPGRSLARTRILLVFLIIRYAGLRLGEALGLDDTRDMCLSSARLLVRGAHAREIPMALPLLAHVQRMFDEPAVLSARGRLTHLDQGYVRRCFYACAEECGLAGESASPRAVRRARGMELIRKGLPLPVVEKFLGQNGRARAGGLTPYSSEESARLLRDYLHRETITKTSARNVFSGRIISIRQSAFLVEVVINTLTGLEIVTIITEESRKNLDLFEGKAIVATIKAPWVMLHREAGAPNSTRNRFTGRVVRVQRSDLAVETVLELEDGSRMCALAVEDAEDLAGVAPGDRLGISFKAFAVVLTAVQS